MVKLTLLPLAILATLAPFAAAKNCKDGLDYCGSTLLLRGNYYSQIVGALDDAGVTADPAHVDNSLFTCTGGSNGNIKYISTCSSCYNAGTGHSDSC